MTFGAALKAHREAVGISQNALATKARIDQAYICRLESGKQVSVPARQTVLNLARALHLDYAETDRLLFVAGLAPGLDYQGMYERLIDALSLQKMARQAS